MLEQGPTEKHIIEQCVRNRTPLPTRIANAPELWLGLEMYFAAFMDLMSCRTIGFAEGPIPWLAVRRYCCEQGIIGEQCEDMHYHINRLDTAYLEHRTKHATKTKPNDGRPTIIRPQDAGNGPRRRG